MIIINNKELGVGGVWVCFTFAQLGDSALLAVSVCLHSQQTAKKEKVDLQLCENVGQLSNFSQYLADKPVASAECGIYLGSHTDEAAGHCVHEIVPLCKERNNFGKDRHTFDVAVGVLGNNARAHLDLVSDLENSLDDTASCHTTLQVIDFSTW